MYAREEKERKKNQINVVSILGVTSGIFRGQCDLLFVFIA